MKFKLIFLLFNILIIGSFLILFFMPAFMVGWDFAGSMWSDSWYLPVLFILFIGILNIYFVFNWRLFSLLEQEKWKELLDFLHDEFFIRSRGKRGMRLNKSRIRIYINGCIVNSRMKEITELADFLKEKQPKLFSDFILPLGMPRLLNEDPAELEEFYGQVNSLDKVKERSWCIWIHSFALMLQKKDASGALYGLIDNKDPMIRLLSLYLLGISGNENIEGDEDRFVREKEGLKSLLTADGLARIREKQEGNVLFFAMTKIIDQAFEWLHGKDEQE